MLLIFKQFLDSRLRGNDINKISKKTPLDFRGNDGSKASIIILVSVMITLLLSSCGKKEGEAGIEGKTEDVKAVPVKVVEIQPSTFTESGTYYGTVQGVSEADLVSYGGGTVSSIKVSSGQNVSKGQQLCNIDGERFIIAAKAAQLNKKIAEDEFNRAKTHLEKETYSQLQVNKIQQGFLQAKQAVIETAKMKRGALCISPISGTVTHIYLEKNQNVPPGSPTISVANLNKIKIKLRVPENEVGGFKKKGKAVVKVPDSDKSIVGKIRSISQRVMTQSRTFEVEARFSNKGQILKPGQTVSVTISKSPMKDRIVVPSEAILNLASGNAVMVANGEKASKIIITKGPSNATHTVITKGLKAGDQLIVEGHALVSDGAAVSISN